MARKPVDPNPEFNQMPEMTIETLITICFISQKDSRCQ